MNDDNIRPMTWEDACSLYRRGFTIGAHGTTHAIMARETKPDAYENISKSIARVTEVTSERFISPFKMEKLPRPKHNFEYA